MRRLWRMALALAMLAPLHGWPQEIDEDLERRIKAVFLYRFPEFINWPEAGTPSANLPFVIDVVGGCSIVNELRQVTQSHLLQGRPVKVKQAQDLSALDDADIVFICDGERARIKQLIQAAPGKALVVTESPGALSDGSVINFVLSNYRVRFEISLDAAKRRGLHVSSRLLDVALAVKTGP
jgi:hypothetical protein